MSGSESFELQAIRFSESDIQKETEKPAASGGTIARKNDLGCSLVRRIRPLTGSVGLK